MKSNAWIRQTHRWLSVIFTLLVLINIVVNIVPVGQSITLWIGLSTLLPLILLLLSGLYLFVLPYANKRRLGRSIE